MCRLGLLLNHGKKYIYIDINLRLKTANSPVTRVSKAEARLVCKTCRDGTKSEVKHKTQELNSLKKLMLLLIIKYNPDI